MLSDTVKQLFPNLADGLWEKTSEEDPTYNCIAHAANDGENWWWPSGTTDDFWPDGAPIEETIHAFELAFGTLGYVSCGMDGSLEEGFEKIAIYAASRGGKPVPTHAARQTSDGSWTSKLGTWIDISHSTANGVDCSDYGSAVLFMKRAR